MNYKDAKRTNEMVDSLQRAKKLFGRVHGVPLSTSSIFLAVSPDNTLREAMALMTQKNRDVLLECFEAFYNSLFGEGLTAKELEDLDREEGVWCYNVSKGKDINKDQSYALWGISQENLSRTIFPLKKNKDNPWSDYIR